MSKQVVEINLRAIRTRAGLSLAATESLTGVSKAMLGQIERGESCPTIATLWKLAKGFELPLSSFITEPNIADQKATHHFAESISVQTLFAFDKTLGTETFLITLPAGCTHLSAGHATGVSEDVITISGSLEVLDQQTWHPVNENSAMRIQADKPHGYRNLGAHQARFLNIIYYLGHQNSEVKK